MAFPNFPPSFLRPSFPEGTCSSPWLSPLFSGGPCSCLIGGLNAPSCLAPPPPLPPLFFFFFSLYLPPPPPSSHVFIFYFLFNFCFSLLIEAPNCASMICFESSLKDLPYLLGESFFIFWFNHGLKHWILTKKEIIYFSNFLCLYIFCNLKLLLLQKYIRLGTT